MHDRNVVGLVGMTDHNPDITPDMNSAAQPIAVSFSPKLPWASIVAGQR